jgi:LAS superfamily LD-carboxypeptidase LdcB
VAAAAAVDAQAAEQAKSAQLEATRQALAGLAVRSYVDGASTDAGGLSLIVGDANESLLRSGYSEIYTANVGDLIDEMRQRAEDLASIRDSAQQADALAKQRRADEADQLGELKQNEQEQQALADKLEARLENTLSEAASLASIDGKLSVEISKRDAELARRLARVQRAPGGGRRAGSVIDASGTSVAGGFRVNSSIAGNVERMVSAAASDGYNLGGSGWRDSSTQVALRRNNCGGSDYAVYSMPASSCRPPTARPGASMHERGLAIDFTCAGSLIQSRSNPCYRWLAGNASSYGFYNLPSEPWHWSVNGN